MLMKSLRDIFDLIESFLHLLGDQKREISVKNLSNESDINVFMHIPKTAGTSIIHALQEKWSKRILVGDSSSLFAMRDYLTSLRCIAGHIPLFVIRSILPHAKVFTVIREPVSRSISFLNHVASDPNHYANVIFNQDYCIDDIIHSIPIMSEIKNFQTRLIGYRASRRDASHIASGDFVAFQRAVSHYNSRMIGQSHLYNAKQEIEMHIDYCVFEDLIMGIGLQNFDFTRDDPLFQIPHMRKSSQLLTVPESTRRVIEEMNNFDLDLYHFAKKKSISRLFTLTCRRREIVDLDGIIESYSGVYPLETHKGSFLRWTNGKATFQIPIYPERSILLIVEIWNEVSMQNDVDSIICSLMGQIFSKEICSDLLVFRLILKTAVMTFSQADIEIYSQTKKFNGDIRTLGVPIKSICFDMM